MGSKLLEYQGFIINDEDMKKIVDFYYEHTINTSDKNSFDYNIICGIENIEKLDLSLETCIFTLDQLASNKYAMNYCANNDKSIFSDNYLSLIRQIYLTILNNITDDLAKAESIPQKADINFKFCETIVKYKFVFTHPNLRNEFYQLWRKINKMCLLNSINNGCVISWLTLLAICPKMVNNNCYPILNKEGTIYKNINWGFINNNNIFKPLLDYHQTITKLIDETIV